MICVRISLQLSSSRCIAGFNFTCLGRNCLISSTHRTNNGKDIDRYVHWFPAFQGKNASHLSGSRERSDVNKVKRYERIRCLNNTESSMLQYVPRNMFIVRAAACFVMVWYQPILLHDDASKWNHFRHYLPLMQWIHRSPVNFPHKGQWRGSLMFSLICAWINGWVNNCKAGD